MANVSLLGILMVLVCAEASSVNLILQDGASGNIVVDTVVSRISQTCIFSDDKRFLRRLAFVETEDGTDANFNGGNNGGIWKIDTAMFTAIGGSALASLKSEVSRNFNIDWAQVTYVDLAKPLYSGLAAALYTEFIISTTHVLKVPRSIRDQSNFWANYYRSEASAIDFEERATSFEDSLGSCKVGADIVFVVDESGSISYVPYQTEKEFVAKVIEKLDIGKDSNQVGVITYASSSALDIQLNTYQDKTSLIQAVEGLSYLGGGTSTHLALNQLVDEAFAPGNGVRPENEGHPRVGIVLTDGGSYSRQQTQEAAARARDAGIILFSVGVGQSVYVPELEGIASDPTCLYYSQLDAGFAEILDLVASISATTCKVPTTIDNVTKTVDEGVLYNCEITVPPKGVSVKLNTKNGEVTLFLSNSSYPSLAYYDVKVSVIPGSTAFVYIPPRENGIVYCSILSKEKTNVTINTTPGRITFNCSAGRSPCTEENIANNKYYFPHDDKSKYVQCGGVGICFDRNCPAGLVWDKNALVCNWEGAVNPAPPTEAPASPTPPLPGYTCAAPNPCSTENTAANGYYFAHVNPAKFVQCDDHGNCFEMPCGPGTGWNDAIKTCDHTGTGCSPNPCTKANIALNGYYLPHHDPTKFIQCDDHGGCFVMPCGPGTQWNNAIKTCDHAPV